MFLELIATIFAGTACAGVAMIVNIATGRRLPRWIVPVFAGLGMLATTVSSEYTWFDRTVEQLPEGLEIAMTVEEQSWVRPWTKVWPYTKRFVAVDQATVRTNESQPGLRLVDLYFFGRWSPVNQAPMLFDCAGARAALLIDGVEFAENGSVQNPAWEPRAEDDPVLNLACEA